MTATSTTTVVQTEAPTANLTCQGLTTKLRGFFFSVLAKLASQLASNEQSSLKTQFIKIVEVRTSPVAYTRDSLHYLSWLFKVQLF